jgi:hypothetical protein
MKGRVYDPLAARFTTADPVMQAPFWSQGLNRYAYTFNDPVNHTDPSGFQAGMNCTMLGACYPNVAPSGGFAGDAGASSGASGSGASSSAGSSAGSGGNALGSAVGIAGTIISTIARGLGGGFLGQTSTPSSKSQTTSPTGQQAANSTPPRVGTDAASANKPVEAPTCNPEWGCAPDLSNTAGPHGAAPLQSGNLNALMDAAPEIGKTAPTWNAIGEGMGEAASMAVPLPVGKLRALERLMRIGKKLPIPRLKSSPFGPKIADAIPKNGVPRNWTGEQIEDAIADYTTSIASRKAELKAFDEIGGSAIQRLAHARRITQEEAFLRSLQKALGR